MSIWGNPVMMGGSGGGNILPIEITENGMYYAEDENADGYNPVLVNVNLLESWNFASQAWLLGQPHRYYLTSSGVNHAPAGAFFADTNSYIRIGFPFTCQIELDVAYMSLTSGSDYRFIMGDDVNGLIYRSTGVWSFYSGGTWADTEETDGSFFDGSNVKVVIDFLDRWKIYKDNVLWLQPSITLRHPSLQIGSSENSIVNTTISSLTFITPPPAGA